MLFCIHCRLTPAAHTTHLLNQLQSDPLLAERFKHIGNRSIQGDVPRGVVIYLKEQRQKKVVSLRSFQVWSLRKTGFVLHANDKVILSFTHSFVFNPLSYIVNFITWFPQMLLCLIFSWIKTPGCGGVEAHWNWSTWKQHPRKWTLVCSATAWMHKETIWCQCLKQKILFVEKY